MHDRRAVLVWLGAVSFVGTATGARASFPSPAVITSEAMRRAEAGDEMLAFLRRQMILSMRDYREIEITIRINERLIRHHGDIVDPLHCAPKVRNFIDGRFYDCQIGILNHGISIFDESFDSLWCERDIRDVAEMVAGEFAVEQTKLSEQHPGLLRRYHVPIVASRYVDRASDLPLYGLQTSYAVAPSGPWDA